MESRNPAWTKSYSRFDDLDSGSDSDEGSKKTFQSAKGNPAVQPTRFDFGEVRFPTRKYQISSSYQFIDRWPFQAGSALVPTTSYIYTADPAYALHHNRLRCLLATSDAATQSHKLSYSYYSGACLRTIWRFGK